MKYLCLTAAIILLFTHCESRLKPIEYFTAFQNMKWLAGSWGGEAQGKPFFEKWEMTADTLMTNSTNEGLSFIRVMNDQVFYTNNPKPGEKLLTWKLADCTEGLVRFENPKAPYSQTILFEHTPDDQWRAILVTKGDTTIYLLHRI